MYFDQVALDQEYILEDITEKIYKTGLKRKHVEELTIIVGTMYTY
jgi:hypothetical protein